MFLEATKLEHTFHRIQWQTELPRNRIYYRKREPTGYYPLY